MNKQSIIIYNLPIIYNILIEIKESLNFELSNFSKDISLSKLNEKDLGNYLILTNSKINNIIESKQLVINKFPINISNLGLVDLKNEDHVFVSSILGKFMDHKKGNRKNNKWSRELVYRIKNKL